MTLMTMGCRSRTRVTRPGLRGLLTESPGPWPRLCLRSWPGRPPGVDENLVEINENLVEINGNLVEINGAPLAATFPEVMAGPGLRKVMAGHKKHYKTIVFLIMLDKIVLWLRPA